MASMSNPASGAANPSSRKTFTVGTRKSKLALSQTDLVVSALKKVYPNYEFKIHSQETAGDLNTTIAFREFTTKNLWTEELEEHLMAGNVDFIVHSLKGLISAYGSGNTAVDADKVTVLRCTHYPTPRVYAGPYDGA